MSSARAEFSEHGEIVVATLIGEVDLANASPLGEVIAARLSNDVVSLVLDLHAVSYLDSAGIQLIYRLREDLRARAQELRLVVPESCASHATLRLAGVEHQLNCLQTLGEALGQLEGLDSGR